MKEGDIPSGYDRSINQSRTRRNKTDASYCCSDQKHYRKTTSIMNNKAAATATTTTGSSTLTKNRRLLLQMQRTPPKKRARRRQRQTSNQNNVACLLFLLLVMTTSLIAVVHGNAAGTETLVGIVGKDFVMLGADSSVSQSISLTSSNLDKMAVLVDPFPSNQQQAEKEEEEGEGEEATTRNEQQQEEAMTRRQQQQQRQQAIVVAAAGDSADADRLVALLTAHAAIREYEASVGCDVDFVDLNGDNGNDYDPAAKTATIATPPGLTVQDIAYYARGLISKSLRSRAPYRVNLLVAGMMYHHNNYNTDEDNNPVPIASGSSSHNDDSSFISEDIQKQIRLATAAAAAATTVEEASSLSTTASSSLSPATPTLTTQRRQQQRGGRNKLSLKPYLFWLDEYGSLIDCCGGGSYSGGGGSMNHINNNNGSGGGYGAHGYGSNFMLSILDQNYKTDISRKEAISLIRDCFQQLRTRYVINSPQPPCIKCIDSDGCRLII